jgi:stage V sporulation protein R
MSKKKYTPLTSGADWSYDLLHEYYSHIERIAKEKLHLNTYANQLEIISSDQMLEAYATNALPLIYDHWSIGMRFVEELELYKRGRMGLAYEVVINSNPCIAYLMEENTMMMQLLVIAHAAFGHNHFFKNNYMFRQWTDASSIIDYLAFAKNYIGKCEEEYGASAVEEVLDACHALHVYGVDKYKRPAKLTTSQEKSRKEESRQWMQSQINEIWIRTIPQEYEEKPDKEKDIFPPDSVENILYFIEKSAPNLPEWKREIIRIVRKIAQYFYPQTQVHMMNEGFATFCHYNIVREMYDEGLIGDGYMQEFLKHHTNVILQIGIHDDEVENGNRMYSGINVYALGFAMYNEIKRVSMEPTEEDRKWFHKKDWVGNGKWLENIHWAAANFKDESFILEFITPKLIRFFRLISILDDDRDTKLEVSAIHNDSGYRYIRDSLSTQYNTLSRVPEIQVAKGGVNRWGDRSIKLQHIMHDRRPLHENDTIETLKHLRTLWGYNTKIESVNRDGEIKAIFEVNEDDALLDVFLDDDS